MPRKQRLAIICLVALFALATLAAFLPQDHPEAQPNTFNPADLAWMLSASGLVLLMTPALAFFYGGMTSRRSVLNMMMMSFVSIGIIGVVWVLWGSSVAGGDELIPGILGNPFTDFGSEQATHDGSLLGIAFSSTFAIIAVALISGAIADRAKFGAWCIFVPLWVTLVYAPVAYMVWADGGLLKDGAIGSALGEAIDFAGGTVVHINAGMAGLVLCLIIGARRGFGRDANQRPHNLPFVMLGAALLWFGWFGFNGGSELKVSDVGPFEQGLLTALRTEHKDILTTIATEKALSDETRGKLKAALDQYAKSFA